MSDETSGDVLKFVKEMLFAEDGFQIPDIVLIEHIILFLDTQSTKQRERVKVSL